MWHFHGPDCGVCDPGLTNFYGLGSWNTGITQPLGWTYPTPTGLFPHGTYQPTYSPFTVPMNFFKTDFTPYSTMNTNLTPYLWNQPFGFEKFGWGYPYGLDKLSWGLPYGFDKFTWGQPFGFEKFGTMKFDTMGYTPWHVNGLYGTLPYTMPLFNQSYPLMGSMGWFGTSYPLNTTLPFGFNGYTPFGITGLDEKFKFGTPFTTGLFGFHSTPFQTPIDWKVRSFTTPLGMTTDTWNTPFRTNLPWTTGRIPGPLAVL
jgi:hypothetical protein